MMEVIIDGVKYVPEKDTNLTVADVFTKYIGTKEYDGVVATIQKWYYGTLVKASWCATSLSWCLSQLGIMKYTIGKKQENVYHFVTAIRNTGTAKEISVGADLKRGDILVFNWNGSFSPTSDKHITSCNEDTKSCADSIPCIGGNQSDMICIANYPRNKLVAVFRPDYTKSNKVI